MNPKNTAGVRKAPLRYLPLAPLVETAEVMESGADKYGAWNWRQDKIDLMGHLEAIERHLFAKIAGEDADPDSGHDHLAHVIATCLVVLDAEDFDTVDDNRVPQKVPVSLEESKGRTRSVRLDPRNSLTARSTITGILPGQFKRVSLSEEST